MRYELTEGNMAKIIITSAEDDEDRKLTVEVYGLRDVAETIGTIILALGGIVDAHQGLIQHGPFDDDEEDEDVDEE
jgi:hypothetical protein